MKFAKIPHYVKRARELGARKTLGLVTNRMQTSLFEQYKRYQADKKKAALSWKAISQKHGICDFPCYWPTLKKRSFSFLPDMYKEKYTDTEELIRRADSFAHDCFDILGSREQCLMELPWHADFRLQYQHPDADYLFDSKTFYKDVVIQHGLTDRFIKDIKVPWELSRFQHVAVLGAAYQETKNPLYSKAFIRQVTHWIDENPYLLGPNWVCPMDVGIRALNWIWGIHYFKDVQEVSQESWEKIVTSLYNHMIYLENNWEIGAVTSNHYLSDLIGYFYLTWFFSDMQKIKKRHKWCYNELLKEFEKQVFDEGTDYEGSTKYHQLVTEIFYNFYMLCQESGFAVPEYFVKKFKKMFTFLDWCSVNDDYIIKIGDDDSGKIVDGISSDLIQTMKEESSEQEIHYNNFGLSIIKTKKWHVSLRHHVYQKNQPSGHFHNDAGSVTVAVNGVPVIVDSGSYVYTPSAVWRNEFRSVKNHNTFFIKDKEPTEFSDESLFMLEQPEKTQSKLFVSKHSLYGVEAQRVVTLDIQQKELNIVDSWDESVTEETGWNFTLAPHIVPYHNGESWDLFYKTEKLCTLVSDDIDFDVYSGWYAPNYGTKTPCKQLKAFKKINDQVAIRLIT